MSCGLVPRHLGVRFRYSLFAQKAEIFALQAIPEAHTQMHSGVNRNKGKATRSIRDSRCRQSRGPEREYLSLLSEQAPGAADTG